MLTRHRQRAFSFFFSSSSCCCYSQERTDRRTGGLHVQYVFISRRALHCFVIGRYHTNPVRKVLCVCVCVYVYALPLFLFPRHSPISDWTGSARSRSPAGWLTPSARCGGGACARERRRQSLAEGATETDAYARARCCGAVGDTTARRRPKYLRLFFSLAIPICR